MLLEGAAAADSIGGARGRTWKGGYLSAIRFAYAIDKLWLC